MSAMDIEEHKTQSKGHYLHKPTSPNKNTKTDKKQLKENLKKASADIVVGNTQNEYQRYANSTSVVQARADTASGSLWTNFTEFCRCLGFVMRPEDVAKLVPNLPAEFPDWIALWIMDKFVDILV